MEKKPMIYYNPQDDSGGGSGTGTGAGFSGGYDAAASKVLEAKLAEARSLIDPLTKKIPWGHLPKTQKFYTFGVEVLPYLPSSVKLRLLIEHKMAWGGAGHCRKLSTQVFNFLEGQLSYGLGLWETTDDYGSLSKERVQSGYHSPSLEVERDTVLEQWLGHYRKFLEKQAKKAGRIGVNLASVPYVAGPKDIKDAVEGFLNWKGAVAAIDPWWKKESWNHDGTVTVYLPKVAATQLVEACQEGNFLIGKDSPRVIKAWYTKTGSQGGDDASQGISSEGDVLSSDDIWG